MGWDNACVEVNGFADPGEWSPEDISKARADFLASELRRRGVGIPIQTKWRGGSFPNSKPGMTGYSPSLNMRTELIWHVAS